MSICSFCQTDLGDAGGLLNSGRCPTCGNLLAWNEETPPVDRTPQIVSPPASDRPKLASWSPPSTNDPVKLLKATLARIITRDLDPDSPQKPMAPLMPPAPSGSRRPLPLRRAIRTDRRTYRAVREARRTRGNDSGTVDFSVTPPNLPKIEGADSGATSASTDMPGASPTKTKSDSYAPTITPGSFSASESDLPPDAARPAGKKPSTYDDKRFAATYDSGTIAPEDTEKVAKLWRGTFAESSTPRTSLKQDTGVRAKDSRLVIKNRALKEYKGTVRTGADYELINTIGEGGMV